VIIAEDVEGEALCHARREQAARHASGGRGERRRASANRRKAMLEDIATLTGARPSPRISASSSMNIKVEDLGKAKK
jgi:chaperonin GroEL